MIIEFQPPCYVVQWIKVTVHLIHVRGDSDFVLYVYEFGICIRQEYLQSYKHVTIEGKGKWSQSKAPWARNFFSRSDSSFIKCASEVNQTLKKAEGRKGESIRSVC